jgi:hypothetical protein
MNGRNHILLIDSTLEDVPGCYLVPTQRFTEDVVGTFDLKDDKTLAAALDQMAGRRKATWHKNCSKMFEGLFFKTWVDYQLNYDDLFYVTAPDAVVAKYFTDWDDMRDR